MTFRVTQRNRINELQKLYNAKRKVPALKKDSNQERYLQARNDINSFIGALPEKKDFAETAGELFSILKKHQINIGQTVYKPESVDFNGLTKYVTSLTVKGTYSSLKAVLADIQESKTLFCVEDLAFSNSSNLGDGSVEMKLKIATYFR
jgi:hypothetical protein